MRPNRKETMKSLIKIARLSSCYNASRHCKPMLDSLSTPLLRTPKEQSTLSMKSLSLLFSPLCRSLRNCSITNAWFSLFPWTRCISKWEESTMGWLLPHMNSRSKIIRRCRRAWWTTSRIKTTSSSKRSWLKSPSSLPQPIMKSTKMATRSSNYRPYPWLLAWSQPPTRAQWSLPRWWPTLREPSLCMTMNMASWPTTQSLKPKMETSLTSSRLLCQQNPNWSMT